MIILATVIILTLDSSNIIERANEAKDKTNLANLKEVANVALAEYKLEVSLGTIDGGEISASDYVKDKLEEQGVSEKELELLVVTDDDKILIYKEPVIPAGFTKSDISTEDEILEGVVIYEGNEKVSTDIDAQTTRNQYVWVPVPEISEFVRKDGYFSGELQTYVFNNYTTEPSNEGSISETNDLTGEYEEYAKMKASVEKYGGFYLARYEAGTTIARSYGNNGTTTLIPSKKGAIVYNWVAWETNGDFIEVDGTNFGKGVVELSRSVYPESANKDIVSTLCYGVQWDATMNFMSDVENPNVSGKLYIQDSTGMGVYEASTFATTGSNDNYKVKNIYDMAGNVEEYTMEAYSESSRVIRGAAYSLLGALSPASVRSESSLPIYSDYGFRVALYIK